MILQDICNFEDFCAALKQAGFTLGGGNPDGVFTLCQRFAPRIQWHTEDPETDPWQFRMRVLDERSDIAYAKLFFSKSGYITQEWYPFFLALRRGGETLADAYERGSISHFAYRIYNLIAEHGSLPTHAIKPLGNFGREDAAKVERALVELQMRMFITQCGQKRKASRFGLEYGWNSTVFCTVETFFGEDVMREAAAINPQAAEETIRGQILRLNPDAEPKKVRRFMGGM